MFIFSLQGGENQTKKVSLREKVHPSLQKAISIVREHFVEYAVNKQDFLEDEEKWGKVLALVPDEDILYMHIYL